MRSKEKLVFACFHTLMIGCMLLIFCFSAQSGEISSEISGGVLAWILATFSELLPESFVLWLTVWIRKVAHYLIYLLLGLSASGSFCTAPRGRRDGWYLWGFLTAVLYACTDEFHQLFVPDRAGQLADVCLDSAGALLGTLLVLAMVWMRERSAEKEVY